MSHQVVNNSRYKLEDDEDYKNLDEERKEQILKELHREMENLKVKYMLDEKEKNYNSKKPSGIKELESLTKRENKVDSIRGNSQLLEKEDSIVYEEMNYSNDEVSYNYENSNENEIQNEDNIEYNNENDEENYNNLQDEEDYDDVINHEIENESSKKIDPRYRGSQQPSFNKNYEIFDKAKENLLKIRNELDDIEQYNYKNINNSIRNKNNNISVRKEVELDDNIEEEQPKNLEHEISISKSIKDESQYGNMSVNNSQYKFNNPYISEINNFNNFYNFSPIPQLNQRDFEVKKQSNNYMPMKGEAKCNRSKSRDKMRIEIKDPKYNSRLSKSKTKNIQPSIGDIIYNRSNSGSKEKTNSTYFKK
jgi:hypothetical protein